jgi:uncharacterized protein (DUF58 family)
VPEELFDKSFLKKLEYLDLIARRLIFGREQALRPSAKKGANIEFKDFREYVPGDDPRTVDWSVYARLRELVVKLYRQEEDLNLWVFLDTSRSMDFGEPSKFDHARQIAAALAYIGLGNMDSASILPFSAGLLQGRERLRGRGQIFALLDFLTGLPVDGRTDLIAAVRGYVSRVRRPNLVVLISDFYGLGQMRRALDQLRFFKHQIYVIQVVAPWELDPPIRGEYRLVDMESGLHEEFTITDTMLRRYRQAFAAQCEDLRRYSMKYSIGYSQALTSVPFETFLLEVLKRGGLVA